MKETLEKVYRKMKELTYQSIEGNIWIEGERLKYKITIKKGKE